MIRAFWAGYLIFLAATVTLAVFSTSMHLWEASRPVKKAPTLKIDFGMWALETWPEMPVEMADGRRVLACDLRVGDKVHHPHPELIPTTVLRIEAIPCSSRKRR